MPLLRRHLFAGFFFLAIAICLFVLVLLNADLAGPQDVVTYGLLLFASLLVGYSAVLIRRSLLDLRASSTKIPSASGERASGTPVTVESRWYNPRFHGRLLVRFERGYFFLVTPGWDITPVVFSAITRTDDRTLIVETGWLQYGKVTLRFDTSEESSKVEGRLRAMLNAP